MDEASKNRMIKKNKKKGFSLFELMIVMVVIGILSSIGMGTLNGMIDKAKFAKGLHFESTLRHKMILTYDAYVAFWTFGESAGSSLIDGSGQGNDLTIPTGVTRSTDVQPYATDSGSLDFDASNGIQILGNTLIPKDKITVSLWFKLKSHKNYNQLYRYVDSRVLMRVANNEKICFNVGSSPRASACAPQELDLDTWYHAAGVYDGTSAKIYINGVLEDTDDRYPGIDLNPSNSTEMWLGVGDNQSISVLNGYLDNVLIWGDEFDPN